MATPRQGLLPMAWPWPSALRPPCSTCASEQLQSLASGVLPYSTVYLQPCKSLRHLGVLLMSRCIGLAWMGAPC